MRRRHRVSSTSAAVSAYPTFPATSRSTSRRSARTSLRSLGSLHERLPALRPRDRTRALSRRRSWDLRLRSRRSKRSRADTRFLITDGGMHHHLAASGNFGQVIRRNYPVLIGNRVCRAAWSRPHRGAALHAAGYARRQNDAAACARSVIWWWCFNPARMDSPRAREAF